MINKYIKAAVFGTVEYMFTSPSAWSLAKKLLKIELAKGPQLGKAPRPKLALQKVLEPTPLPTVNKPIQCDAKIELHEAKRAGDHLDFRIKYNDSKGKSRIIDFAVVKRTNFPDKTGKLYRVVRTPDHSLPYFMADKAKFGPGEYGHGDMSVIWRGKLDLITADPSKMEFRLLDGPFKGTYCIRQFGTNGWAMLRMKDPEPFWKERQRFDASEKKLTNAYESCSEYIAEHKLDGANFMLVPGPKCNQLISRRLSVTGDPIDRSDYVPWLKYYRFPEKLHGKVIHTEVMATDGRASSTASILNSNIGRARSLQMGRPGVLRVSAWDLDGPGGYIDRRSALAQIAQNSPRIDRRLLGHTPDRFLVKRLTNPRVIDIPESNLDLLPRLKGLSCPRKYAEHLKSKGYEGAVVKRKDADYYADTFLKDKKSETHDFNIIGFQEGTNKYKNSLGAFVCQDPRTGAISKVGTGFSDAQRRSYWDKADELYGKTISVEVHEFTHKGVARGPRFVSFHSDISQ